MKPTLLILAAGMGSRYGSLKQIDPVGPGGETIMDYSVFDAIKAGFGKVVFVIRKNLEPDFKEFVIKKYEGKIAVDYAFQELSMVPEGTIVPENREKPWGTGHAVLVANEIVNEPFAVINADDYYGIDAYMKMNEHLTSLGKDNQTDYSMVGYQLENTLSDFGAVSRGICSVDKNNYLVSVVERTNIERVNENVAFKDSTDTWVNLDKNSIVSMNFWGFTPSFFPQLESVFKDFIKENLTQLKSELYIPTVIDKLIQSKKGRVKVLESSAKWFGVTYKEDKPIVVQKIKKLVDAGVYPAKLWK